MKAQFYRRSRAVVDDPCIHRNGAGHFLHDGFQQMFALLQRERTGFPRTAQWSKPINTLIQEKTNELPRSAEADGTVSSKGGYGWGINSRKRRLRHVSSRYLII